MVTNLAIDDRLLEEALLISEFKTQVDENRIFRSALY